MMDNVRRVFEQYKSLKRQYCSCFVFIPVRIK